jgi:hypothetical protein
LKEDVKVLEVDRSEEGVLYQALNDLRTKRLSEGKTVDLIGDLLSEIVRAPTKKARVRGDAR